MLLRGAQWAVRAAGCGIGRVVAAALAEVLEFVVAGERLASGWGVGGGDQLVECSAAAFAVFGR